MPNFDSISEEDLIPGFPPEITMAPLSDRGIVTVTDNQEQREIAEKVFTNLATHLALQTQSSINMVLHPEFVKARGRLIEAVGQEKADRIQSDFFLEHRGLFARHVKNVVEYR